MNAEQATADADKRASTPEQALARWRAHLEHERQKGLRAELKRCRSLISVMCHPEFFRLQQSLEQTTNQSQRTEAIAVIAGVTPFLKRLEDAPENKDPPSLARSLGYPSVSERPIFSELRFQRLLAVREAEDLMQQLRRALTQVDRQINYLQLHWDIKQCFRQWHSPDQYQGTKQWQYRWSRDYYQEVLKYKKQKES